jgi:hypothetical protein
VYRSFDRLDSQLLPGKGKNWPRGRKKGKRRLHFNFYFIHLFMVVIFIFVWERGTGV